MTEESREQKGGEGAGRLYVVSAPSGAGKSTLVRALVGSQPGIVLSVSHTTRPPRPGEEDGVHYHFVEEAHFEAMVAEEAFLEHARVFDHFYGTSREWVLGTLRQDVDVILEIDWQGARQVRRQVPECVGIFILPPSLSALEERLGSRGQDSEAVIRRRMRDAVAELSHFGEFDYLVVNDDFDVALADLVHIVRAGVLRQERQHRQLAPLLDALLAPTPAFE